MSFPVKLHVYDISHGLARTISVGFLGRYIDGLWHTGICVYGNEYFFGGDGIAYCPPGGTILGHPAEIVDLGHTGITLDVFHDYLENLSQNMFAPETYHLIDHNCNTFSDEVARFLADRPIPDKIRSLSADIMNTQFGQLIRPMIEKMQGPIKRGTYIGHHKENNSTSKEGTSNATSTSNTGPSESKPEVSKSKRDPKADLDLD